MDTQEDEPTAFKSLAELTSLSASLLSLPLAVAPTSSQQDAQELAQLTQLCNILDEYQEQSYLLDPHLEDLVKPLIQALRAYIKDCKGKGREVESAGDKLATKRVGRLARLIYFFTKVRGAKTILRLFPHDVTDLPLLLSLLESPTALPSTTAWELRYILLLWFSLVVMLPFPLRVELKEDDPTEGDGLDRVEKIAMRFLGVASIERDAGVLVLGRYYARSDTSFDTFLGTCLRSLQDPSLSLLYSAGLLSSLCLILKLSPPQRLLSSFSSLYNLTATCHSLQLSQTSQKLSGSLVGRYRVKLIGRLALLRLGAGEGEDGAVAEEVEVLISDELEAVSDEETVIRYSAAKYLARIHEKLPPSLEGEEGGYREELVEGILSAFDEEGSGEGVHDLEEDKKEDRWHGACLALAEICRRGGIKDKEVVERVVRCILKAIHFDKRRSFQSIGTPIRDASSYALWSLSRTVPSSLLSPSLLLTLSRTLLAVTLFDREISIRRAAGAAFQECVGRWGKFENGIELLKWTDFFTVGSRRKSFLVAAGEVAKYSAYRGHLVEHLRTITLNHYDIDLRSLAGQSLELILKIDPEGLLVPLLDIQLKELSRVKNVDSAHGIVLSLGALAGASSDLKDPALSDSLKEKIFTSLISLNLTSFSRHATPVLLIASLEAMEKSCTETVLRSNRGWFDLVEMATLQIREDVHLAAGAMMRRVSELIECGKEIER